MYLKTFLPTLPELVMPLKWQSLSLCICPLTLSAPCESLGTNEEDRANHELTYLHARKYEARSHLNLKEKRKEKRCFRLDSDDLCFLCDVDLVIKETSDAISVVCNKLTATS